MTPPQQNEIDALQKQIADLQAAKDIAGLRRLVADAKNKWLPTQSPAYYPVIHDLCYALKSMRGAPPEVDDEIDYLAVSVIDAPGEKPPDIVSRLYFCTRLSEGSLKGEAWAKERHTRMERTLKIWKSIREQLAAMPEPSGKRYFRVSPPPGTGLPDGVGPEAVKDPVLRKQFEEAIERNKRNVDAYQKKRDLEQVESFFSRQAKGLLLSAYTVPPFHTEELDKMLNVYAVDKVVREAIVSEVRKREADQIEHDAKYPNTPPRVVVTEIPPPGTWPYHSDLRLRKTLTFSLKAPMVEDMLRKLSEGTGIVFARADDIQNQYPALGSYGVTGVPAWKIMDDLAASKRVQGRWEKDGDGYRLFSNGTPVVISEATAKGPDVAPEKADGRGYLYPSLAVLAALGVVSLVIWRVRARRKLLNPTL